MKNKQHFTASSSIKLGAALGDWTQLSPSPSQTDHFEVSTVDHSGFDRLSKIDQKKILHLHHSFTDLFAKKLSEDMNIKVELHTISVAQLSYAEFIKTMDHSIFQADMTLPDTGIVSFIFGSTLASMMLDRLTGGIGKKGAQTAFNPLQMSLLSEQLQQVIPLFNTTWKGCLNTDRASLSLYSGAYKPDNRISYRETYVVFTLCLHFGDGELMQLVIAYPNQVIRTLLRQYVNQERDIIPSIALKKKTVETIAYPVRVQLGSAELSMSVLNTLEKGDIILLNQRLDSLISVEIGGRVRLRAQPCVYKGAISCQIVVSGETSLPVQLKPLQLTDHENPTVSLPVDQIVCRSNDLEETKINVEDRCIVSDEALATYLPKEFHKKSLQPQYELAERNEFVSRDSSRVETDRTRSDLTIQDQANDNILEEDAVTASTDDASLQETQNEIETDLFFKDLADDNVLAEEAVAASTDNDSTEEPQNEIEADPFFGKGATENIPQDELNTEMIDRSSTEMQPKDSDHAQLFKEIESFGQEESNLTPRPEPLKDQDQQTFDQLASLDDTAFNIDEQSQAELLNWKEDN